ncbi:MAG: hypothetical protein SGI83_03955 [Bacteroidota bacterium]|nr:hypothetical protein [Bacteroidota bacterium]
MKKSIFIILLTGLLLLIFSPEIYAQKRKTKDVKATAVDITRGNNPYIKTDAPITDIPEPKPRKTCSINFSNYTGYFIKVYVDGRYRGQLSPNGGGSVVVTEGYTSIYCITAGKTLEWFETGNCFRTYRFRLYP